VGKPKFRFGRGMARAAVVAAVIAATGLAGCGRKSGLDLPPTASLTDPQAVPPGATPTGATPNGPQAPAQAPPAPPRRFLLDFLLN
jgi:predicted small lipoprotein YifL